MDECGPKPSAAFQRKKYIAWKMCKSGAPISPKLGERNNKENAFMDYGKKRS